MLDGVRKSTILLPTNASEWLQLFGDRIDRADAAGLAALFLDGAYWRDLLAFSWHFRTVTGAQTIEALLRAEASKVNPRDFRLAEGRTAPRNVTRIDVDAIEAIFSFETDVGNASGVVRLVADARNPGHVVAWTFMTCLEEIHGFEGPDTNLVPRGLENVRDFGGENWLDRRIKSAAYQDRDPTVLVIGAGQAGLGTAARLNQLGVDTLIVDRQDRIGDNWRNRYHSLVLHNEIWVNHLPFMPFPPTWPTYIPKDKLANWFEAYAENMELNIWTKTEFVTASYDTTEERWTAVLSRDGKERVMHPRHIVFATGVSGIPNMPKVPGLDAFGGQIVHSSRFSGGEDWAARKVIVVGTGNSAHDVAQDLHSSGAKVTMIQRGTTQVVSMEASADFTFPLYREGMPTEDCDLLAMGTPFPVYKRGCQMATSAITLVDKELLERLDTIGFRVDYGHDDTGYLMSYLLRGGGYYFNVGCSDLLISGEIGLVQYSDIDAFDVGGLRLADGTHIEADLVVLATGYQPQSALVRKLLGDEVAERVGDIWGFDASGELRNIWKSTNQPGLWFAAGSLGQCRMYSKILALQIKAREEGLVPRTSKPGELSARV